MRVFMNRRRMLMLIIIFAVITTGITAFIMLAKNRENRDQIYRENRRELKEQADADLTGTEKEFNRLEKESRSVTGNAAGERNDNGIMVLDQASLKRAFRGTAVVGDSFIEAIEDYNILEKGSLVHQRGINVAAADELLEKTRQLNPSSVFLQFGDNDLELYGGDTEAFRSAYKSMLEMLRQKLPDAAVYVNAILPIQQTAIDEVPARAAYPQYNEVLQELSTELGCTFLDGSFIAEGRPEMYEPDGIHLVEEFYWQWLSYLAEKAGL